MNFKMTQRKEQKCPMCSFRSNNPAVMSTHLVKCGHEQMSRKFNCSKCDYTALTRSNLNRHYKKCHAGDKQHQEQSRQQEESCQSGADQQEQNASKPDNWEACDPGDLAEVIGIVSDSESCTSTVESRKDDQPRAEETVAPPFLPVIRKPTRPNPVFAPKRPFNTTGLESPQEDMQRKVGRSHETAQSIPTGDDIRGRISAAVQTDPLTHKRTVWKTTRYIEDDRDIEIVEMDEYDVLCSECNNCSQAK